ncbi:MAG: arsenosugar biosynthesis radical SAM (seleno)protein ArsS [Thermoanaerobaculia bacterium]
MSDAPLHAVDDSGPDDERREELTGPRSAKTLRSRHLPLASPVVQLELLAKVETEHHESLDFDAALAAADWDALRPAPLEVFQINLGKLCNMTCRHCHVDAGPDRWDAMMSRETIDDCLRALDTTTAHTVDLTGGAPELHPHFEYVVEAAVARGKHVIDRCNLSVLLLPRSKHLPAWFAERGVEVVASLPHYRKRNTDAQRGDGAFEKSIEALRLLNAHGYGTGDPTRILTLMCNPAGAFLAPNQAAAEAEWKAGLAREWGISFDRLFTLNNMPVSRFLEFLVDSGNFTHYMSRLAQAFNPRAIGRLMCRNTISISWDGRLYDCDFNQMLELDAEAPRPGGHVRDFDLAAWQARTVVTRRHCFGCTAGSGSSCGGATS